MTGQPKWANPIVGPVVPESVKERRSTLQNDNGIVDGETPPKYRTRGNDRGKFFPRGCRGMLEQVQIYCKDAGVDTITLWVSPYPGLAPIHKVSVTPLATWAWRSASIEQMWNYDSMFIMLASFTANPEWGYDEEEPYDGHQSDTDGETFYDMGIRPFIRAVYTGETSGDVPVSGTINVVEIPSVGTLISEETGTIDNDDWEQTTIALSSGTVVEVKVTFETDAPPTAGEPPTAVVYKVALLPDCVVASVVSNRDLTQDATATKGRSSIGEFYQMTVQDPEYKFTVMNIRLPVKFRRGIFLSLYQSSGGTVDYTAKITSNIIR